MQLQEMVTGSFTLVRRKRQGDPLCHPCVPHRGRGVVSRRLATIKTYKSPSLMHGQM